MITGKMKMRNMKGCVYVHSCRKRHTNKNGEKEQRSRVPPRARDTTEQQRDRHIKGKTDIPGGKGNRHILKR